MPKFGSYRPIGLILLPVSNYLEPARVDSDKHKHRNGMHIPRPEKGAPYTPMDQGYEYVSIIHKNHQRRVFITVSCHNWQLGGIHG